MSGGGEQSSTTTASVPQEFMPFIFGPSATRGAAAGTGDAAPAAPASGGGLNSLLANAAAAVGAEKEGRSLLSTEEALGAPVPGILPDAYQLYAEGGLAPYVAPSATTQQALGQQKDLATQLQELIVPQVTSAFQQDYTNISEAVADAATRDLQEQLQLSTMPSITQGAIAAGQMGSSRQGIAEGLAQSRAAEEIAEARADILFRGQELEQQAANRQIAQAGTVAALLGLPSEVLAQVGAAEDVQAQEAAFADYRNLLSLSNLIQGFIPGATQTTTIEGGGPSPVASAAGGAATGFAIGGPWGAAIGGGLGLLGTL